MKCDSRYRRPYLSTTAVLSFLSIAVLAAPSFAQPANPEDVQEGYESTPEDFFNSELKSHISLQSRSAYKGHVQKQGDRYIAYIGHHNFDNAGNGGKGTLNPMTGEIEPNGTSIVDVTDPPIRSISIIFRRMTERLRPATSTPARVTICRRGRPGTTT